MINVAILGFGVVGAGVAEVLSMNADKISRHMGEDVKVKYILDIRDFPGSPFESLVTHDADQVFGDPDVSVVVETIGGARIAYEYTKRALSSGKSVVTSNKELVATHGVELMQIAKDNGCRYLFEAAVGGGIPIIRPLHRCLAGNKIMRIAGIVNGTTNYILTNMRTSGLSYEEVLKQAQEKGYAEQDPTADVEGIDAQRKLSILSSIALEGDYVSPDEIHTDGISGITLNDINFATKINCSIKLLAVFSHMDDQKPSAYVAPHFVAKKSQLAPVEGVFNAILVKGNAVGTTMYYGRGAGKLPTASAVVGDVLEAALPAERNAYSSDWHFTDASRVTADYEDVVTNIVVRAKAGSMENLVDKFSAYTVKSVWDGNDCSAVIVFGIAHKDIDALVKSVEGNWMHYME
ncbi:MAG: homoserine dehydrogenase [Clostridiales bacterium]|nr:homoserine dehydrogenase [Clostridiales bacterium]